MGQAEKSPKLTKMAIEAPWFVIVPGHRVLWFYEGELSM